MDVDHTVREDIWNYPMLFKSRSDVLHHLFYVIGNGYEWFNGELVDKFPDLQKNDDHCINNDENHPLLGDIHRQWNQEARLIRSEIDERVKLLAPLSGSGNRYPASDVAFIHHLPDDIKPDWAEAAEQIRPIWEAAPDWVFPRD